MLWVCWISCLMLFYIQHIYDIIVWYFEKDIYWSHEYITVFEEKRAKWKTYFWKKDEKKRISYKSEYLVQTNISEKLHSF